jgi:uncharacterized DUF497 family protein
MKIEFTKHAENKLALLKAHGFKINKDQVKDVIKDPDSVKKGKKDRYIAQKVINKTHILRVIYIIQNQTIRVITLYPARRTRYENKI